MMKKMQAQFASKCCCCGKPISVGDTIVWFRDHHKARHFICKRPVALQPQENVNA
jgi:hypothetical protein